MSTTRDLNDTWVKSLAAQYGKQLAASPFKIGAEKHNSACYAMLCAAVILDLPTDSDLLDGLTEGGGDNGVDFINISDIIDGEFNVSLFQAKYDKIDGDEKNFPESGILPLLNTLKLFFRIDAELPGNARFKQIAEEIRSNIREGDIPRFSIYFCNNGKSWVEEANQKILAEGFSLQQVTFHHVNHDTVFELKQKSALINLDLKFSGLSHIDQFNFKRVIIGKISAQAIYDLVEQHGTRLFEKNIRRYLGTRHSEVNQGMAETLSASNLREDFYFLNNGVTCLCNQFRDQGLRENNGLKVTGFQIVNGAQTCHTIHATLAEMKKAGHVTSSFDSVFILLRIYEVAINDPIGEKITFATNHQNPIEIYDLRANDKVQVALEASITELEPAFTYRRKRDGVLSTTNVISPLTVAEAVFAVWRRKPHTAKFRRLDLFRKHYDEIFSSSLTGAQALLAVSIFRAIETRRKSADDSAPDWIGYGSYFISALIGKKLLLELGLDGAEKLTNSNYERAKNSLAVNLDKLYQESLSEIEKSLQKLIIAPRTLQKLSAAFRRPDLCESLELTPRFSWIPLRNKGTFLPS